MTATVHPINQPEPGWLYIMRDPSRLGYCKVGMTTRDPDKRAAELSTGSPVDFVVAYAWRVPDVRAAERDAHAVLDRWRVDGGGEWFKVTADRAAAALRAFDATAPRRRRFHRLRVAVEIWGWFTLATFAIGLLLAGVADP